MRISDWSSDVCSSDLHDPSNQLGRRLVAGNEEKNEHLHGFIESQRLVAGLRIGAFLRRLGEHSDEVIAGPVVSLATLLGEEIDRKSVVSGKSVSVRVALGGRRIIKKKTQTHTN